MTLWSRELDGLRARLVDLLKAGDGLATLLENSRPGARLGSRPTSLEIRDSIRTWDDAARAAGVLAEHGHQRPVRP